MRSAPCSFPGSCCALRLPRVDAIAYTTERPLSRVSCDVNDEGWSERHERVCGRAASRLYIRVSGSRRVGVCGKV